MSLEHEHVRELREQIATERADKIRGAVNSEARKRHQEALGEPEARSLTEHHPVYGEAVPPNQVNRMDNLARFQGRTYRSGKPRQSGEWGEKPRP